MISIIIPVFKSGAILEELFARICSVMESLEISFEVIFVNDCRNDFSWEIIKKLKAVNSQVRGILLSKNYGQHNALLCGIVNSNGHFIVTCFFKLSALGAFELSIAGAAEGLLAA